MDTSSDQPMGHLCPADRRAAMHRDLRWELLSRADFQDLLVHIDTKPPAGGKMRWTHTDLASFDKTRIIRAGRIHLMSVALRGLLSCSELDFYASVIEPRRASGIWPKGGAPLSLVGTSYEPSNLPATKEPAAPALIAKVLARCAQAAADGESEELDDRDRLRLSRALQFLGLESHHASPSRSTAATRKRAQRQRAAMAPVVDAERQRLDAEVAAGRMIKLGGFAYVESAGPEADAATLDLFANLGLPMPK